MVEADKDRFQVAMAAMAEVFRHELTPESLRVYFMALCDLDIRLVEKAAMDAIKSQKFFPKPVELRALALPGQDVGLAALNAWVLVRKHAVQYRVRKGPMNFGQVINCAVRSVGGIDFLATAPVEELENFTRKRFIDAFILYSRGGFDAHDGRPLVGEGAENKPVVSIGTAEGAVPVFLDAESQGIIADTAKRLEWKDDSGPN